MHIIQYYPKFQRESFIIHYRNKTHGQHL